MAFVGTFFAAVGRVSVRYRWAIVAAWVAGTVAAMALLPSLSSVTGVGLALGVLMDTFGVRTLLVPSAVVLIGRWNWWPSALCRARPCPSPLGDDDASPRADKAQPV